jgi:CheY-like chemotaxis protein
MKEIVDWLKRVEKLAHDLYSGSSEFFGSDKGFSEFMKALARDEAWHFHLMDVASDFFAKSGTIPVSGLKLDSKTMERIERPLRHAYELLSGQALSQTHMLETIVVAERSEWNSIFMYTVNSLKDFGKPFQHVASVIQAHQDRIERFLCGHQQGQSLCGDMMKWPKIWNPRFLIVDDDEPLRFLLRDLLNARGATETARDGKDGLEKVRENFFNLIVSDIGMPNMNGLDFYKEAVKEDPRITERFIFCSGEIRSEHERFLGDNGSHYLRKPFAVNEFMNLIEQVLQRSNLPPETFRVLS